MHRGAQSQHSITQASLRTSHRPQAPLVHKGFIDGQRLDSVGQVLLSLYKVLHRFGALAVHLFTVALKGLKLVTHKTSNHVWVHKQSRTLPLRLKDIYICIKNKKIKSPVRGSPAQLLSALFHLRFTDPGPTLQ